MATSAEETCSLPHATGSGSAFTVRPIQPNTSGGCTSESASPTEGNALPKGDGFTGGGDSDSANAVAMALAKPRVHAHQRRHRYGPERNRWPGRHTVIGTPAEPSRNQGGEGWSAYLRHWQGEGNGIPITQAWSGSLVGLPGRGRRELAKRCRCTAWLWWRASETAAGGESRGCSRRNWKRPSWGRRASSRFESCPGSGDGCCWPAW